MPDHKYIVLQLTSSNFHLLNDQWTKACTKLQLFLELIFRDKFYIFNLRKMSSQSKL